MNSKVELIKRYYSQSKNYSLTGRKFGLSRQRVHQLITGYKTITYRKSKKIVSILARPCSSCGRKSEVIHHIDSNSRNNQISNLAPLCKDCHVSIHTGSSKFILNKHQKLESVSLDFCEGCEKPFKEIGGCYVVGRCADCWTLILKQTFPENFRVDTV